MNTLGASEAPKGQCPNRRFDQTADHAHAALTSLLPGVVMRCKTPSSEAIERGSTHDNDRF